MANRRRALLSSLPLLLGALAPADPLLGDGSRPNRSAGVVVEEVAKDSSAEKARMQAGDVVHSWFRPPTPPAHPAAAEGRIESPFDLTDVETEQAPRGPITFTGSRGESEMTWTLPPVPFGLTVRPILSDALLGAYQEGKAFVDSPKPTDGAERWRAAAADERVDQPLLVAWFLSRAAKALADAKSWPEADAVYAAAVREAEQAARPTTAASLLTQWAGTLRTRRDSGRERDAYRQALALDEKLGSENLAVARDLNRLGGVAWDSGDIATAAEHWRRALAIREKLAPGSMDVAASLNNLALFESSRGDLAAAAEYSRRSLTIHEKLAPGSLAFAANLNNLANLARQRGDLAIAEDLCRRALAIKEQLAPGSLALAASLDTLGVVLGMRGDLAAAEDQFRRALAIEEKLAPGSPNMANSLDNLGIVRRERGDLASAAEYHGQALAIREKLVPGSRAVASSLTNLGYVARDRGDLAAAGEYQRRALAIKEKLVPEALDVTNSLSSLGDLAKDGGDLEAAANYCGKALDIRQRLAPGSADESESLHDLGLVYREMGRVEAGSGLLLRALDVLDSQKTKLGGTEEVRTGFAARYRRFYHDSIETLIALGRPAEALHVLERSRARSLLALLAERDLLFPADLPAELARERRLADAEYDRVLASVAKLNPAKDDAEVQKLLGRLREIRQTQEEIASRVRAASPRLASLQYPEPLNEAGVRSALDPGTAFLAYSVGTDSTVLFLVQPTGVPGPGVTVFSLPVAEKALRQKVEAFRGAIQRPSSATRAALSAQAAELYDLLIRPAEAQIGASERLLVSPDGPLHSLPFAALLRKDAAKATRSYLVEWKPLHIVPSATVYAELKRSRRVDVSPPGRLVAFGDPRYPDHPGDQTDRLGNPDVRSATRDFRLGPLPYTRREVEGIASLFPGRAQKYLGDEATEERAKSVGRETRFVHFACHATLDERFPLNSSLALTIPETPAEGQDNGLLQAWEIFDQVRLDADLVTLSACNTGLGKEMGGEGLLGLTRAFHYAGARSVLATLWAVSDKSTSLLMKRFYGYVHAGRSRDEALRAAQMDLIRARSKGRADLSLPVRWAAFQLSGDWR